MAITVDYGLRTYELCDPEGNLLGELRFNPSDPGFAGRWEALEAKAEEFAKSPPQDVPALMEFDKALKRLLDEAFAAPVSAALFQGLSCFALCPDGSFVLEHIMDALKPVVQESMEQAVKASERRMARHTAAYEGADAGLAPGQQA